MTEMQVKLEIYDEWGRLVDLRTEPIDDAISTLNRHNYGPKKPIPDYEPQECGCSSPGDNYYRLARKLNQIISYLKDNK